MKNEKSQKRSYKRINVQKNEELKNLVDISFLHCIVNVSLFNLPLVVSAFITQKQESDLISSLSTGVPFLKIRL